MLEDISWLKEHDEARRIMILLLLHLVLEESTTEELFGGFIFEQHISRKVLNSEGKRVEKGSDLRLINADDFYNIMYEREIIKNKRGFNDLKSYLGISKNICDILVMTRVKKSLELMYGDDEINDEMEVILDEGEAIRRQLSIARHEESEEAAEIAKL